MNECHHTNVIMMHNETGMIILAIDHPLWNYDNDLDAWLNILRSPSDVESPNFCHCAGDVVPKCHTLIIYLFYNNWDQSHVHFMQIIYKVKEIIVYYIVIKVSLSGKTVVSALPSSVSCNRYLWIGCGSSLASLFISCVFSEEFDVSALISSNVTNIQYVWSLHSKIGLFLDCMYNCF